MYRCIWYFTKSQPDHESSLLNILFCGVRFEHPRTKYHSLLGPVPFQVEKMCSKNVVTSRYLCMPQKRDTENPMKNLSYLALLLGAKNSCFSTDEKRFLLFWPRETPFPFRFSSTFLTLKEYVNDPAFQPVFLNSFIPLEDQTKCRNIFRPRFSDRKTYRPQQCLTSTFAIEKRGRFPMTRCECRSSSTVMKRHPIQPTMV